VLRLSAAPTATFPRTRPVKKEIETVRRPLAFVVLAAAALLHGTLTTAAAAATTSTPAPAPAEAPVPAETPPAEPDPEPAPVSEPTRTIPIAGRPTQPAGPGGTGTSSSTTSTSTTVAATAEDTATTGSTTTTTTTTTTTLRQVDGAGPGGQDGGGQAVATTRPAPVARLGATSTTEPFGWEPGPPQAQPLPGERNPLPYTGGEVRLGLAVAAGLVAGGGVLVRAARRRPRQARGS
jgi:hypothetical protein